jgi:hypothetical protein
LDSPNQSYRISDDFSKTIKMALDKPMNSEWHMGVIGLGSFAAKSQ